MFQLTYNLSTETTCYNLALDRQLFLTVQTAFSLPSKKHDFEPIAFGKGPVFSIYEDALVFVPFRLSPQDPMTFFKSQRLCMKCLQRGFYSSFKTS